MNELRQVKGYPSSQLRLWAENGMLFIKWGNAPYMIHKVRKPGIKFDAGNMRTQQRAGRLFVKEIK